MHRLLAGVFLPCALLLLVTVVLVLVLGAPVVYPAPLPFLPTDCALHSSG